MRFTRRPLPAALALTLASGAGGAFAQDFPTHPIKLVIPQAPGSGADAAGRGPHDDRLHEQGPAARKG